jgi:hypothetical protein
MIMSAIFVFTGCSNEKVDQSKAIIEEYYEECEDYDTEDIIDLFHDDLIDVYSNQEELEIVLKSRIAVLGDIDEYKVSSVSYYKNNGEITVTLDVDVTYKRTGETYVEQFVFLNDGDDMKISNIYHENEPFYDEITNVFFKAYSDMDEDEIADLFSDSFFTYVTKENLISIFTDIYANFGEYKSHELVEEWYYYEVMTEDVVVIYEGTFNVEHSSGSIKFTMQTCVENDEIKINYLAWSEE